VRAGVHAGECEVAGSAPGGLWVRGIAVHIGARVQAKAGAGEILVSSTAKEAAAGSGLRFRDRGRHALRGLPGRWRLFAADVSEAAEPTEK
jgi:class 3 adenylate cyclase